MGFSSGSVLISPLQMPSLRSIILLLLSIVVVVSSIRCYSSQQTVPGTSSQLVVADCPAAQFCYKSYIERDTRGDHSYTETRTCGNVGTCYESGCTGPGDNRQCCCVGDLCNSASLKFSLLSLALPLLLRFF